MEAARSKDVNMEKNGHLSHSSDEELSALIEPAEPQPNQILASELDNIIYRLVHYEDFPDRTIEENKA